MSYRKSGETRERILEAAARLFDGKGYYEVCMGDIAKEAGTGRATLYYHFDGKERIARSLCDSIAERAHAAAYEAVGADGDILTRAFLDYILVFKHIALNKATRAVYYDLVSYADYDKANIERLKTTVFRDAGKLAAAYGVKLSDKRLVAYIISSDALAKSLFKGIINRVLDFDFEEAMDHFCRRAILCDIPVPEAEYKRKLKRAFRLCEGIDLGDYRNRQRAES